MANRRDGKYSLQEMLQDLVGDLVTSLRARIAELEGTRVGGARPSALRHPAPPAVEAPARSSVRRGARDLSAPPGGHGGLSQADWATLREAAGSAPPRLAAHERAARAPADQTADSAGGDRCRGPDRGHAPAGDGRQRLAAAASCSDPDVGETLRQSAQVSPPTPTQECVLPRAEGAGRWCEF